MTWNGSTERERDEENGRGRGRARRQTTYPASQNSSAIGTRSNCRGRGGACRRPWGCRLEHVVVSTYPLCLSWIRGGRLTAVHPAELGEGRDVGKIARVQVAVGGKVVGGAGRRLALCPASETAAAGGGAVGGGGWGRGVAGDGAEGAHLVVGEAGD